MTYSNDHIRRELRAIEAAHRRAMPSFEAALDEAFDPSSGTDTATKAELVGAPSRRHLLKLGGLTLATTAIAAACVEPPSDEQVAVTGTIIPTPTTVEPQDPGSPDMDATLVLTAISIEKLAIEVYQRALDSNWLEAPLVVDVAEYFRDQHGEHEQALAGVARQLGQNPAEVPANPYLMTEVVEPEVTDIEAGGGAELVQSLALTLARDLEIAATQTYTKAGGVLTTPTLRQTIMSIGGIEARHSAVLAVVIGDQAVPFALEPTTAAAPKDAYIEPNGTVRPAPVSSPGDDPETTGGDDPETTGGDDTDE